MNVSIFGGIVYIFKEGHKNGREMSITLSEAKELAEKIQKLLKTY